MANSEYLQPDCGVLPHAAHLRPTRPAPERKPAAELGAAWTAMVHQLEQGGPADVPDAATTGTPANDETAAGTLAAGAPSAGQPAAAPPSGGRYVTFALGRDRYALPLAPLREIIRLPAVAQVPLAPPALLGLVDLRGETLPILSLHRLLRLGEQADEMAGQALVVDVGLPVGLLVDRVDGIVEVAPEALEGVGTLRSAVDVHALAGVIRNPDGMVTVLDLDGLVGRDFPNFDSLLHGQAAGQQTAAAKVARDERRLVSYLLDGQEYATPIDQLREIVGLPEQMLRPPGRDGGHHLLGVMSLRGRLLPLLGLRRLFGLPDPVDASACRVVVLQAPGGEPVGVVVDAVNAVLSVDRAEIDTLPELFGHGSGRHRISGLCRLEGGQRLVGLIEADCLPGTAPTGEAAAAHEIRPAEPARSDEQFVVFRLDREEFGVPIAQVQEIVRRPEQLRRIPGTPDFLEGVSSLRGSLLGVVDQRRRFAMPPQDSNEQQRVMVFRFGERCLGFIVDSVSEVLRIPLDAIGATPPLTAGTRRMLSRVANLAGGGRIVQLLDPAELLDPLETQALAGLGSVPGTP